MEREGEGPPLSSALFLDRVGEVELTLDPDGLSWKPLASQDETREFCLGLKFNSETESAIRFSDIYAVETIERGLMYDLVWKARRFFHHSTSEMYRFVVHGFQKHKTASWALSAYTFGHADLMTCKTWVEKINAYLKMQVGRPKNLLVFVHPLCGKGTGLNTWGTVAPIFSRAKVDTKVIVTQRAGYAFDMISSSTDRELSSFDGIVAVGGDGLFNEILNGLLSSRHKAPFPPTPAELNSAGNADQCQNHRDKNNNNKKGSFNDLSGSLSETRYKNDDSEPLLSTLESNGPQMPKFASEPGPCNTDQGPVLSFPNNWFRLGIIPSGSTDAIVIRYPGTFGNFNTIYNKDEGLRDPVTSALQIVLGKRMPLDIAQVVRWKSTPSSVDLPSVRYAASFAGYGFYGDVVKESEKYRWMGPKRYDFAGTKVFLKHRSYEAEITFLDAKQVNTMIGQHPVGNGTRPSKLSHKGPSKLVCQKNCIICNETTNSGRLLINRAITSSDIHSEDSRWLRSKGRFLSVGAAVISCRNERAPDGLVADAHLADGFLHLILIKDCPRPHYLWHLTQLTRKGSNPLNFEFVEHHKTSAFTFVSSHDESVWNLDGELFQACQVSVQVCRGLVNLFASGPDV